MSRAATPVPLDDRTMWRKIKAAVHPDRTGEHEPFLFVAAAEEHFTECRSLRDRGRGPERGADRDRGKRIPFDPGIDFEERTLAILRWYRDAPDPYRRVMILLVDCGAADHGRAYQQQYQGASYRQLAAIAHAAGMDFEQRQEWYAVAESVGLAERHAAHILNKLKSGGRRAA